jgi:hypothetical protein
VDNPSLIVDKHPLLGITSHKNMDFTGENQINLPPLSTTNKVNQLKN